MKPPEQYFKFFSIALLAGWLTVFVLLPNLMVIAASFLTRDPNQLVNFSFSLDSYLRLIDPVYFNILMQSTRFALIATVCCLLLAYPFAYAVVKAPKNFRPFLLFLLIVPFWTNSLIRTYALKIVLGRRGLLNDALMSTGLIDSPIRFINTETAVVIGMVYILLPFMVFPIYSSLEKLDSSLIEAAKDLGATSLQCFLRITLPLTTPGILAGTLLVFLPAMGMFYVADLLGGAKNLLVGNIIKTQFLTVRDWPFGSAASVLLTLAMGLMLLVYWWTAKRTRSKGELDG